MPVDDHIGAHSTIIEHDGPHLDSYDPLPHLFTSGLQGIARPVSQFDVGVG